MTADMTPTNTPAPSGLLPCPFCGNTGDIEQGPASQASGSHCSFRGWCDYCCFGLEWTTDQAEAIAAWNRRTPAPFNPMCASDGCDLPASVYFEKGGVGSHYCSGCGMRIQSLVERSRTPAPSEAIAQPIGEPAAWQWRFKLTDGPWSDWNDGRVRHWVIEDGREYEERPLYASPSTEVERLTRERDRALELADKYKWQVRDTCTRAESAEATIRSLEERLAEAERLLEPFAAVAEHDIGQDEDEADIFWPMRNARYSMAERLRVGNLRAARSFLTKIKEGQS